MATRRFWILRTLLALLPGIALGTQGPQGLVVSATDATITPQKIASGTYPGYSILHVTGGSPPYAWRFAGAESVTQDADPWTPGLPVHTDAAGNSMVCGDNYGEFIFDNLRPTVLEYCNFGPNVNSVGGKFLIQVTDSQGLSGSVEITIVAPLRTLPLNATVMARGSLALSASGGIGSGYTWTLADSRNGGTLDSTGHYTAGPRFGVTDTVQVKDAIGTTATITIPITQHAPITITPAAPSVSTSEAIRFSATGGTGKGFRWSLAAGNTGDPEPVCSTFSKLTNCWGTSKGTIDANSGAYVAGTTGGTVAGNRVYDTIVATDSAGNTGRAIVSVISPLKLSPTTVALSSGQVVLFSVSGGYGSKYQWKQTLGPSQGRLLEPNGVDNLIPTAPHTQVAYIAGNVPDVVDQIAVSDPSGAVATVNISVSRLPAFAVEPGSAELKSGDKLGFGARQAVSSGTHVVSQPVPVTWSLSPNDSGGSIDPSTGAYVAGPKGSTTDWIQATDAAGHFVRVFVQVRPTITLSPSPASVNVNDRLIIAASSDGLSDPNGGPYGDRWSFHLSDNSGGATISAVGLDCSSSGECFNTDPSHVSYVAGPNEGVDTITATNWDGRSATLAVNVRSPLVVTPAAPVAVFQQSLAFTATGGSRQGYVWSMASHPSSGTVNSGTGSYTAGTVAGTDVVQVTDSDGRTASVSVQVRALVDAGKQGMVAPSGPTGRTAPADTCAPPVPPAKASAPIALSPNLTLREAVGKGQTCFYNAAVNAGQMYTLSVTGIVGAAQLTVFDDPKRSQPTACLAPKNLQNATFAQPADCTFIAHGTTVYAAVKGTSDLAVARNAFNIRISPHFEGGANAEGAADGPKSIALNHPYGGTVAPAKSASSYYVVNTAGSGDVVISLTGLVTPQAMDLRIFDNPKFEGALNNRNCFTGELDAYPESCVLPSGPTYYVEVRNQRNDLGGPFTLMVDLPTAATTAPAPNPATAIQQAMPALNKRSGTPTPPPPAPAASVPATP